MKVSQGLAKALRLFRKGKGWVKGTMWKQNDEGEKMSFCSLGAIDEVFPQQSHPSYDRPSYDRPGYYAARDLIAERIHAHSRNKQIAIHEWNDARRRRYAEVERVFLEAIAEAKKREKKGELKIA